MNLIDINKQLQKSPLVHRTEVYPQYIKIMTDILLGVSYDYLNVYIIEEDDGFYISDSNNIYMVLDDYYTITEENLSSAAKENGFTFDEFRLYKQINIDTVNQSLEDFQKVVFLLTDENEKN